MFYIVFIVQELDSISKLSDINKMIKSLLRDSDKCGIFMYFFSEFSDKKISFFDKGNSLSIGKEEDLVEVFSRSVSYSNNNNIIDDLNGIEFESFCGTLLENNGYRNVKVTKSSGDFGADIIAEKDDVKYAIQCKKFNNPVGISAVQEVMGSKSIYDCHVAVVLTNSTFTKSAKELAKKSGVLLWDGNKLSSMIEKNKKKTKLSD